MKVCSCSCKSIHVVPSRLVLLIASMLSDECICSRNAFSRLLDTLSSSGDEFCCGIQPEWLVEINRLWSFLHLFPTEESIVPP